jgi:hypothetical protein
MVTTPLTHYFKLQAFSLPVNHKKKAGGTLTPPAFLIFLFPILNLSLTIN